MEADLEDQPRRSQGFENRHDDVDMMIGPDGPIQGRLYVWVYMAFQDTKHSMNHGKHSGVLFLKEIRL